MEKTELRRGGGMKNMCSDGVASQSSDDTDSDSELDCGLADRPAADTNSVTGTGGAWPCGDCRALHPAEYLGCPISFKRRVEAQDTSSDIRGKSSCVKSYSPRADGDRSCLSFSLHHKTTLDSNAFSSSCMYSPSPRRQVGERSMSSSSRKRTQSEPVTIFSSRPKPFFPHLQDKLDSTLESVQAVQDHGNSQSISLATPDSHQLLQKLLPITEFSVRSPAQMLVPHWQSNVSPLESFDRLRSSSKSGTGKSKDMSANNASESSTDSDVSDDAAAKPLCTASHFTQCHRTSRLPECSSAQKSYGQSGGERLKNLSADNAVSTDSNSSDDSLDQGNRLNTTLNQIQRQR